MLPTNKGYNEEKVIDTSGVTVLVAKRKHFYPFK